MRRVIHGALLVGAMAAAAALAWAEKIERDGVQVMAGPGSFYPAKGKLAKGTEVTVGETKGSWKKVTGGGVEGYIPASALVSASGGGLSALGGVIGSKQASVSADTAAAKGFNQDVEKAHAQGSQADFAAVDKVEARVVAPADVLEFLRARGLVEDGI